jgi:hypothetical protein
MRALGLSLLLLAAAPATASAAADLEAVWSFSGGQVAIQAQSDGTFDGTVIRPTTFSECTHPTGEIVWDDVRAQSDGQYWGRHQWFRLPSCEYHNRGNTAFRVLTKPDGAKFLRVCWAGPEDEFQTVQPSIAPDGTDTNAPRGCQDSDLVSELPSQPPTLKEIATLPKSGRRCGSRRNFTIRLREPRGDALKSAKVRLNRKNIPVRRVNDRLTARINLTGLPKGRYTVRITAQTYLGRTIKGARTYRTCAKKRRRGSGGPL